VREKELLIDVEIEIRAGGKYRKEYIYYRSKYKSQ